MTSSLYFLRRPAFRFGGNLLCASLMAFPSQLLAQQPGPQRTLKEIARPYYAAAEFELSHVDATDFDVRALQKTTGTTPASLTRWVRDETRWVPYAGALKGARGTLLARQGNLLDRNLLLAALLEAGGREARLVHFETSVEQQDMLRKAAARQVRGGRTGYQRSVLQAEMLEAFCNSSGLSRKEATSFIERQDRIEKRVEGALKDTLEHQREALFKLIADRISPARDDPWTRTLGRYVYVQHRSSKNDSWESAHLVSPAPTAAGEMKTCAPGELPDAWLHRVGVKVIVVQQRGDKTREQVALEQSIPTAMAGLVTGQLQLVPSNLSDVETLIAEVRESRTVSPLTRRMAASRAWIPVIRLEGMQPEVGSAIDRNGRLVPVSRIGVAGQNEEGLGKALGLLNKQLGDVPGNNAGILKEVRIEFSFRTPGRDKARVMTRPLYTRLEGAAAKLNEDQLLKRSLALSSRINLLLTSGHLPAAFTTQKQATARLGLRLATDYITAKGGDDWHRNVDSKTIAKIAGKFDVFPAKLYGIAAVRSSSDTFLSQPNAIAWWERVMVGDVDNFTYATAIDFIENRVETAHVDRRARFRSRLNAGLRDSIVETEAVRGLSAVGVTSTVSLFEKDGCKGWQIVTDSNAPVLKSTGISATARKAIHDDLDSGYLLVVRPTTHRGTCAWWRIDPASGECLGMAGAPNWIGGQSKTEVVGIIVAIAIFVIVGHRGIKLILKPTEETWKKAIEDMEDFHDDMKDHLEE